MYKDKYHEIYKLYLIKLTHTSGWSISHLTKCIAIGSINLL